MDAQPANQNRPMKPSILPWHSGMNAGGSLIRARRRTFVPWKAFLAVACASVFLGGCGGESSEVAAPVASSSTSAPANGNAQPGPGEIVSQLLDRIRRGGDDANSGELLTSVAQRELERIGRPFEFPGSPDTTYQVGQTLSVPDEPDAKWVQTYLSEPVGEGETFRYEVVWTLKKETQGWRVSGFALDQGEGLDPLVFDFENGDEIAARLAEIEQPAAEVTR